MRFVKAWWPIYADDPHWVAPLLPERKRFLDPRKNPYFQGADVQCFLAQRDYYGPMYEALGLGRVKDWHAYRLEKGPVPDQVRRIAKRLLDRHRGIELRPANPANFEQEVAWLFDIYHDAWADNWGHVPMTRDEFTAMASDMKPLMEPTLFRWAFVDGEPAAAAVTFPDFNPVLRRMGGRLFPFGWYHWWRRRKQTDTLRVFLLGVKRKYQHLPLGAPLYLETWEAGLRLNVRSAEASLVLENNHRMRSALEKLGARVYPIVA